jgi:hypothetical protein
MASKRNREQGRGQLSFLGGGCEVEYEFSGDPKRLNGEGTLLAEASEMRAAFAAGRAILTFEDGRLTPITVIAQTDGDPRAFFEIRTARAY